MTTHILSNLLEVHENMIENLEDKLYEKGITITMDKILDNLLKKMTR